TACRTSHPRPRAFCAKDQGYLCGGAKHAAKRQTDVRSQRFRTKSRPCRRPTKRGVGKKGRGVDMARAVVRCETRRDHRFECWRNLYQSTGISPPWCRKCRGDGRGTAAFRRRKSHFKTSA